MERHNVLILSNLDTVEHLEIGIWLISDMEKRGHFAETGKKGGMDLSLTRCASWES